MIVASVVQAFVHYGLWVADCPFPYCGNCEPLDFGQTSVHCRECLWMGEVTWPDNAHEIAEVLDKRPVPGTRHWAPAGHRQAIACGFPDGQSVADLLAENEEHL